MNIHGESRVSLKVPDLGETVLPAGLQDGQRIPGKGIKGAALLVIRRDKPPQFPGTRLGIKNNVEDSPKKGNHKDNKNPGKFIGRLFSFTGYIKADQDAQDS
jgi:hypothetical protein